MSVKFNSHSKLKTVLTAFSLMLSISVAQAEDKNVDQKNLPSKSDADTVVTLPTVTVTEETLGGDVLLINMKDYMVIQRSQSKVLESELGAELKKQFTRDIVMTQSVEFLQAQYGGEKRPVTNEVIKQYAEIINIGKKRKKLD